MQLHRSRLTLAIVLSGSVSATALSPQALANVWVLEPSAGLDTRLDSNYTIDPIVSDGVTATRAVATLSISREQQAAQFTGLFRVDGLLTQGQQSGGDLGSNQIAFFSAKFNRARSDFGISFNFKRDTPSRDISADLTDISSVASDTGASVTQDQDVARTRFLVSPNWSYNLTRRTKLEAEASFTLVNHALPSAEDSLLARWAAISNDPPPDPITIDDTGFFTIDDELDDYREFAFDVGIKTQLSPITTLSFSAGFSNYVAEVEPEPSIIFPFDDTIPDSENPDIRRKPKRDTKSNTATFRVGYDRAITPTLNIGGQIGFYANDTDQSDLLRETDNSPFNNDRAAALDNLNTSNSGFLANITAVKDTGITQYSAKIGIDVLPSDVGSTVESLEAIGDVFRQIGPLLDASFRIRAYEPDAFNASTTNRFARRFLSMEPRIIWRFKRAWTTAASYRYRRQKSQVDTESGESHALLFSIKYTKPSAIRDAGSRF